MEMVCVAKVFGCMMSILKAKVPIESWCVKQDTGTGGSSFSLSSLGGKREVRAKVGLIRYTAQEGDHNKNPDE